MFVAVLWSVVGGGLLLVGGAFVPGVPGRVRSLSRNLLVSYVMLVVPLLLAEGYMRWFFAQSENGMTWATQNWLERHWEVNELGYRDRAWTADELADREVVAVLGDSFAAGWGIDDREDRFSDVLGARLGDDYAVVNMGVYGSSTVEQLENLRAYPHGTPDVVVLQYYLNDIAHALLSLGMSLDPPPPPGWSRTSALGNFIYDRGLKAVLYPDTPDGIQYLFDAYDNFPVWAAHRAELEAFIDYTEDIDARLIVVIFPEMTRPFASIPYVDRVAEVFEAHAGTDVLKLFDEAEAWTLAERTVSHRDTHPSAAFHRYVGEALYASFFAEETR